MALKINAKYFVLWFGKMEGWKIEETHVCFAQLSNIPIFHFEELIKIIMNSDS
jgi:hypothetical protein